MIREPAASRYLLLLGSNLDRKASLDRAESLLRRELSVLASSSVYESEPVGAPETPLFLNRAILATTFSGPVALKSELRAIEAQIGRVRDSNPNSPRTIDIDIICAVARDGRILSDPPPDPDLYRFHHVAFPAAEIGGEFQLPDGERLAELASKLGSPPPGFRIVR